MAERHIKVGNSQVILTPSSGLLKVLVVVLVVLSVTALVALNWVQLRLENQTRAMHQEAVAVQHQNQELQRKINALGSEESVREIARDELGMADPDTILIQPGN